TGGSGRNLRKSGILPDLADRLPGCRLLGQAESPPAETVKMTDFRFIARQSFCCSSRNSPLTLAAHVSSSVFSTRGARRFTHRFHLLRTASRRRVARIATGTPQSLRL